MKDRIPGAPGQYKASVSQEELQKLQSGAEFTITMTRDDQPIVEGTPYSKAAVLPDSLAEKLCPSLEDPSPADALEALYQREVESAEYPGCYYRMVDGNAEWINPPMVDGVEYRTMQRYDGHPVYVKSIITENFMDTGTLEVTISDAVTGIVGFDAYAIGGYTMDSLPMFSSTGAILAIAYTDSNKLKMTSFSNISGYHARILVRYIK